MLHSILDSGKNMGYTRQYLLFFKKIFRNGNPQKNFNYFLKFSKWKTTRKICTDRFEKITIYTSLWYLFLIKISKIFIDPSRRLKISKFNNINRNKSGTVG